ncbi:MAG: radical SAM protein, partial [Planctomycetes bacterium]|nr:radical SAM protein [Planctomycetota bacterium]
MMDSNDSPLRVSLIQMPRWSIQTPPFTLALLTGILRKEGFTVFPKDYEIEFYHRVDEGDRQSWANDGSLDWNDPKVYRGLIAKYDAFFDLIADDILKDTPRVIGFTVRTWSSLFSCEVAQRVKQRNSGVHIVFGGPEMNRDQRLFLEQHPEVDAICRQEGDLSFPSYLKKFETNAYEPAPEPGFFYRDKAGKIVDCGPILEIPQTGDIPFADYSDFDFSKYTDANSVTLIMSRGCIFRCSFCAESACFLKYRSYPARRIVDEFKHVLGHSNVRTPVKLNFNDSLLNGDLKALEEFADQVINDPGLKAQWYCMMALRKEMSDELIEKLAKAGCRNVFFGMESASPKVLKMMRKTHDPETASRLIRKMHEQGIEVCLSIIVGHPGEGESEFYETLNFLRKHAKFVKHILLHPLTLCAGSALSKNLEKYQVDPATVSGNETIHWVGDQGTNTLEVRLNRLFVAQHLLAGKLIDYGGAMDRDADNYHPLEELSREHTKDLEALGRLVRQVRVNEIDETPDPDVG